MKLDETVVKHLLFRIRTEGVNETWFDEIQTCVYEKLQVRSEAVNIDWFTCNILGIQPLSNGN